MTPQTMSRRAAGDSRSRSRAACPQTEGTERSASRTFLREVRAEVAQHFAESSSSPFANRAMVLKSLLLVGAYVGVYAALLTGRLPLWAEWALCPVFGVAMAGIGFAVAHDALHGAYAADARTNSLIALIFEAIGANGYAWRLSHNGAHHTCPNIIGSDEDVEVTPLLRLSPYAARRPFHRFQHWFAFPLYALTTLNWIFVKDFAYFGGSLLGRKRPQIAAPHWVGLLIGKLLFYTTMAAPFFVLPLPVWQIAIGFLTVHLTAGAIIGGVFQLAHVVEDTDHWSPGEGIEMREAHALHQMRATSNFAPTNRLLSWFVGGLNYQVEHHLFPRVCHVHYRAISVIVRQAAARHSLPYNSLPSLSAAVGSHLRMLKTLGRATADGLIA